MKDQAPFSNDWRKHWQQSIAVRISGVVLWVLVPLVMVITFILLFDLETEIQKEYQFKGDILMHRTIMAIVGTPDKPLEFIRPELDQLRRELGFNAVEVNYRGISVTLGSHAADDSILKRQNGVESHAGHAGQMPATATGWITMTAYYASVAVLVREKQSRIVIPIVVGLLLFGAFLIVAIQTIVHKPLQLLVDATRRISAGGNVKLNENRPDEFGYLAKFFNEMVDELTDKQRKLALALEEATKANKAKSIFLANTSHELRTPLNAIIGYSEMLAEDASCCDRNTSCHDDVCKIREAGKHLLGLINNILDLSKIEAGKSELFIEEVSIKHLAQEVGATIKPLLGSADDRLRIDCADEAKTMRTDQTKLRQILLNLFSNAIKFTKHGDISLKIWSETRDTIPVMCFRVTDTGIGIPANKIHYLFQAFSQVDLSATRRYGGSGLGLVICKHFCMMLGGDITVHSEPGVGTTFDFYLPQVLDLDDLAKRGVVVNFDESLSSQITRINDR